MSVSDERVSTNECPDDYRCVYISVYLCMDKCMLD